MKDHNPVEYDDVLEYDDVNVCIHMLIDVATESLNPSSKDSMMK